MIFKTRIFGQLNHLISDPAEADDPDRLVVYLSSEHVRRIKAGELRTAGVDIAFPQSAACRVVIQSSESVIKLASKMIFLPTGRNHG